MDRGQQQKVSPVAVQKFLKGMDFPCDKEELIQVAKENGAPQEVMTFLERMPERQYNNAADVSKEIGNLEE